MIYLMLGSSAAEAQGLPPRRVENRAAQAERTDKGSWRGGGPCSPAPARLLDARTPARHAHSQAAACSRTAVLPAAAAALGPQALRRDPASQRRRQCRVNEAIRTAPASAPLRTCPSGPCAQPKACRHTFAKIADQTFQLSTVFERHNICMRSTHAGQFLHHIDLWGWRSRCRCSRCLRWQGIKGVPSRECFSRALLLGGSGGLDGWRVWYCGRGSSWACACLGLLKGCPSRRLGLLRGCISRAGRSFSASDTPVRTLRRLASGGSSRREHLRATSPSRDRRLSQDQGTC